MQKTGKKLEEINDIEDFIEDNIETTEIDLSEYYTQDTEIN